MTDLPLLHHYKMKKENLRGILLLKLYSKATTLTKENF